MQSNRKITLNSSKPPFRKAIAITGAINQKAAQIGQWILDDLRELIATIWELKIAIALSGGE